MKRNYVVIAALSLTVIALELTWTRIFSAEFFYTFAFLVLSLAILGLGLGALALRLLPFLNREEHLGTLLSLTGLMTLAGPPLVFLLKLDFTQLFHSWLMVAKFVVTIGILNAAFFFGGIALAMLFRRNHQHMPRLYMVDLLGAGAGVLLIIPLMNLVGTPVATFLCPVPVLLAALFTSRRWWRLLPIALMVLMVVLAFTSTDLLEVDREEPSPVIYKHWDAMAKVKIYELNEDFQRINLDNAANSTIYGFDGNWDRPDSLKFEFGIDVSYLIDQFDSCSFLSLGAGGGADVLQALQAGATHVHAVEVVPHVNELMTNGQLAEFTGQIYNDPRVHVVTEDARAYVRRHKNSFDLIYSLSSNSWAALASGAFALAENYLFTTEAFRDYWEALTDQGYMMMEHQFYVPRLVTSVFDGLRAAGVEDPTAHFAIYNLPSWHRKIIFLSKRPLTDEIRYHAFGELLPEHEEYIHLLYPPPEGREDNLINQIVSEGWEAAADSCPVDLSPPVDNRPFAAQLGMWKNFGWDKLEKVSPYEFAGFPLAKLLILIIMLVVLVLVVPLCFLPYATQAFKLRAVPWLYFFMIGMAFMSVEVIMIQKYSLLIGPSLYSIATVLLTLLLASGFGSRFARVFDSRIVFLGIVAWLCLDVFAFGHITAAAGRLLLPARLFVTSLLLAPLGFLMGMPFPKGALRVGELIDWGFAINGTASVLGSTCILLVAFTYGFAISLIVGAVMYLIALLLMSWRSAW